MQYTMSSLAPVMLYHTPKFMITIIHSYLSTNPFKWSTAYVELVEHAAADVRCELVKHAASVPSIGVS